jgi:nucleoside-diphosphate-sugar epimerase
MKVLITGASGFVGSALWSACEKRGWEVMALGRRPMASPVYRQIDLSSPIDLPFQPDAVVHLAARSSPWGKRQDYHRQNITATRNVVEFCTKRAVPHLIYISTSAVLYRNEHQFRMDENTPAPAVTINEYARTKYAGEKLVENYVGAWSILRPRAVFGPGDTVVFPRILRAAQRGRLPLIESDSIVQGDLIYIDTLVEYIARAIERKTTGLHHLTNNQPVPILSFLGDVFSQLDLPSPTRRVSAKQAMRLAGLIEALYRVIPVLGEPPITRFGVSVFAYSKTFNVTKALRDLGPPLVSVGEGVARFVEWQRSRL